MKPEQTDKTQSNPNTVIKCHDNRTSNPNEDRLSQLLIDHCMPSFQSSLKIQALVVYQADGRKSNSLLVDREYTKSVAVNGFNEQIPDHPVHKKPLLSDSGFLDVVESSESPDKTDEHPVGSPTSATPGSRRKRKLCRPCKIPVNGRPDEETSIVSPSESPTPDVKPDMNEIIPFSTTSSTPLPTASRDPLPVNMSGLPESLLLPVSGVTLLPSLGVFSLPITVFSTLPRPILPRTSIEQPQSSQSTPILSNPTLPTSQQLPILKQEQPKGTSSFTLNSNRRFGKSFVCNQCRKEFTSLNLLCAHTFSVHRGFRCTICRAQFTQRSNLQRHSLRHVGFKPFVCKICEKAYYRKDHLVRHIELAHPGSDPRVSLTVKLSSAECLEYLDKIQHSGLEAEQAQLLYQTPICEPSSETSSAIVQPVTTSVGCAVTNEVKSEQGTMLSPTVLTSS